MFPHPLLQAPMVGDKILENRMCLWDKHSNVLRKCINFIKQKTVFANSQQTKPKMEL